jgi:uncharacterized membrane protein
MSVTKVAPSSNDGFGILMVLLSEVLLASVNTIVKYVHSFSTQQMMLIRNPVDLCLCLAVTAYFGYRLPNHRDASWVLLRSTAYITFISLFWFSLRSCLPLGDVIVFVVTFSPAFAVLMSRVILGESIPPRWPIQFSLCVVGAMLINKPLAPAGTCPASTALWPVSAALAGATMNFCSRNVKEVPPVIMCMFNDVVAIVFAVVSSALGILGAEKVSLVSLLPTHLDENVALLILAGVIGWAGLLANVKGFQVVSVLAYAAVAGYAAVPLGYAIQVLVFKDNVDMLSTSGAALIVGTNVTAIVSKYLQEKEDERKLGLGASLLGCADQEQIDTECAQSKSDASSSSRALASCWAAFLSAS